MNQEKQHDHFKANDFLLHTLKHLNEPSYSNSIKKEEVQNIIRLANLHGVIPQLYKATKEGTSLILNKEQSSLDHRYQHITKANLLLTVHILTLCKALDKKQFNYLAIKGPILAQTLYNNISMRQFSDIDLLVDEKEIVAISELLLTLDYEAILPLSLLKRQKFLELDNDFSFRHKKTGALLELHWKLFPVRHHMPLDFSYLHNNAQTVQLQNAQINALSTEDNLLYLTLHGAKHIFERYEWVYDLHTLIQNHPQLDLESVHGKAKKESLDTPLLLGIFLSHQLFETTLPETFHSHKTDKIQKRIDIVLEYYEKGFVYWDESDKKRARFLFLSELFQNKESKVFWLFKSLFKTTPVDVITFNFPDQLAFLYPMLRPFRLLYKHIFTKKPQYAEV